jgi:hypothetical protein
VQCDYLRAYTADKLKGLRPRSNTLCSQVDALAQLPRLRRLDVSSNRLSSLAGLAGLTSLEALCVERNRLPSLQGAEGLGRLVELYASGNGIAGLQTEVRRLAGLPALEVLDLGDNPLTAERQVCTGAGGLAGGRAGWQASGQTSGRVDESSLIKCSGGATAGGNCRRQSRGAAISSLKPAGRGAPQRSRQLAGLHIRVACCAIRLCSSPLHPRAPRTTDCSRCTACVRFVSWTARAWRRKRLRPRGPTTPGASRWNSW